MPKKFVDIGQNANHNDAISPKALRNKKKKRK